MPRAGLVHTLRGTSGRVSDIVEIHNLLHGKDKLGFGDVGCQGVEKRPEVRADAT